MWLNCADSRYAPTLVYMNKKDYWIKKEHSRFCKFYLEYSSYFDMWHLKSLLSKIKLSNSKKLRHSSTL